MRERDIFIEVLQKADAAQRLAYLDAACTGDDALRRRVLQLLTEHEKQESFLLDAPILGAHTPTIDAPSHEGPGTAIGPYKLLQQIGEGGMGTVFMAEQTDPVRRKVALKVIKPGMDSRQIIARFEAERQALAMMDHVNIARVFDGGTTDSGRPYFVMELVHGVPITKYCDDNCLTPRERLELFVPVCLAIQHAHQKGVIHRDIKPSNVMITLYDGKPVLKVIDFGVAKATEQKLTERTLFTQYGTMVGTFEYMSPEQAEMSALGVDTRSDIYSLGVLLYELLTGSTPLSQKRVRGAAFAEVLRMIKEEEPPRPSTRLSDSGAALESISAQRQMEPAKLTKVVRGELDWIVMKALEKDRNRRYETATGFAADVQRYLSDKPVQACPPSAGYRLRKFVRRNRGPVLAASLLILALVGGIIGTTWGMLRATDAEAVAVDAEAVAVSEAKQKETALVASRQSEREKSEQLWQALVAQARANRLSRRSGQRFESLDTLQQATQLARTLKLPAENFHELQSAVSATLAVPDLYLAGPWNPCPADAYFDFDEAHAIYARTDGEGNCSIRRVADDAEIHRLKGLGAPAWVHFSRDGKFVAVGAHSPPIEIQVWQLDGMTPRLLLSEKQSYRAAFHPNAQLVALSYDDGAIGVFELPSGRQTSRLLPDTLTREVAIALHPTEPLVAVASYFGPVVQVRDVQTGTVLASLPQPARALSVAWHPDGRTLAIGYESHHIRLYDRTTWRASGTVFKTVLPYRTLETGAVVTSIAFDPAGDRLAMLGGWVGILELFDVGTGQKLMAASKWSACRFSQDGLRLAGAVQSGKLGIWQVAGGQEFRTLERTVLHSRERYLAAAVHPEGRLLAVAKADGVGLWDLASGSQVAFIQAAGPNNRVLFEQSGALLTLLLPTGLSRWPIRKEANAGRAWVVGPPERLPLPRGDDLDQSRDGKVIVSCDRTVGAHQAYAGGWILHADRPKEPIRLDAGADIDCIAVSPDGRWVVTLDHANLSKVWDARDGRLVKQLADRVSDWPRFSPDGRWLASSKDGRLLAVETWEPGPTVGAGAVFAPDRDGKLMAVPTPNGIRLVDQATGREVAMLEDPNLDATHRAVFTPDGTKLIAVNIMKGISVWDLRLIRRQLKELGLDWDWPEFPAVAKANGPQTPLKIQLIDPDLLNNQAWVLATHAEPKSRNPGRAVKLAQHAVELAPKEGMIWNTLGVAHYRCGDWKAAIAALTKSMELRNGGDSFDWFFLAMGHWKLDQKKEARKWYDQAIAWMDKNQPQNEELRRFRAEAAELLGIENKKD
jgi:serine/threonine protein kinase/WD40 repeat protein